MFKSKFLKSILFTLVIVGGLWVLFNRDKISEPGDVVALISRNIKSMTAGFQFPGSDASENMDGLANGESGQFATQVVRIASFKLNSEASTTLPSQSIDLIADICRQYDAIAIQQIGARDTVWLGRLVDRMNEMGAAGTMHLRGDSAEGRREYAFISDAVQNGNTGIQTAIVFNQRTLEIGQSGEYTIQDPDRMLDRPALVGCFRARGPDPDRAFTFTLANIEIAGKRSDLARVYLKELYRAIRDDGRMEDDVIIVGDLSSDGPGPMSIGSPAGLTWAISGRTENIQPTTRLDNVVFGNSATVEYTGRSGVSDFMRLYNLRSADAMSISDRMPVWAEFSVFEGGESTRPNPARRVAAGFDRNLRQD